VYYPRQVACLPGLMPTSSVGCRDRL